MKLFTTYLFPPTNKINHCYCQQFSWLETVVEQKGISEIIYLSFNKTPTDLNKLISLSKFKYPHLIKHVSLYSDNFSSQPNWNKLVENCLGEREINFSPEDIFYVFGGILSHDKTIDYYLDLFSDNLNGYNFISLRNKLLKLFLGYYIVNILKLETHHIIFDPVELSLKSDTSTRYYQYHNYTDTNLNFNRLDSLQYYLLSKEGEREIRNKSIDFLFGASILHKSRLDLHPLMEQLLEYPDFRIFYKNKFDKRYNQFLSRPQYLDLIEKSFFTLIIKAYEPSSFSASRFIESLYYNCIPLLYHDSNYHHLTSFDLDIKWLERYLVVYSPNDIKDKIKELQPRSRYMKLLSILKQKVFNTLERN